MGGVTGSHSVRPPHPVIAPSPLRWLHRHLGHPVMLGSGLLVGLAGFILCLIAVGGIADASAFDSAKRCVSVSETSRCWVGLDGTVTGVSTLHNYSARAGAGSGQLTVVEVQTDQGFVDAGITAADRGRATTVLREGDRATLVYWHGALAAVQNSSGDRIHAADAPGDQQALVVFGMPLLIIGAWFVWSAVHIHRRSAHTHAEGPMFPA